MGIRILVNFFIFTIISVKQAIMATAAAATQVSTLTNRKVVLIQGTQTNKEEIERVVQAAQQETKEEKLIKAVMLLCGWGKEIMTAFVSIELDPNQISAGEPPLNIGGYELRLVDQDEKQVKPAIVLPANTLLHANNPVRLSGEEIYNWSNAPGDVELNLVKVNPEDKSKSTFVAFGKFATTDGDCLRQKVKALEKGNRNLRMGLWIAAMIAITLALLMMFPKAPQMPMQLVTEINQSQPFVSKLTVLQSQSRNYFTVLVDNELQTWASKWHEALDERDYQDFFTWRFSDQWVPSRVTNSFVKISTKTLPQSDLMIGFDGRGRFIGRPASALQETWSLPQCNQVSQPLCTALHLNNEGELMITSKNHRMDVETRQHVLRL